MRFERLAIPSFGPFTELVLEFPEASSDLQIIYGTNEAGKSSLLRAVRDLLFGIHGQTSDSFIHPYTKLRIGATIGNRNGQRLSFQRRKGNRQTLLDELGHALPDGALADFLGIVDRHFFSTLFGLGSEELREGSEALLHGQGDLGQALFSASLAGTPIHRILASLDREARTLFDGRTRISVSIRPAVNAYEELSRHSKTAAVRPETWAETLRQLDVARDNRDHCDERLRVCRQRRDWLQRCLDALPTLGQLAEHEQHLATLADSPDLGPAFVEDSDTAVTERDQARETLTESIRAIEQLELRIAENQPNDEILALAATIESAHQRLAVYREWKADLESYKADRNRAEADLQSGIRDLGFPGRLEALEALRVTTAQEQALREAASALDAVTSESRETAEEMNRSRRARDQLIVKLGTLPTAEVSELRLALAQTAVAAEAVAALPQKRTTLKETLNRLTVQHGLLAGAPADYRVTFSLPVPSATRLRQYDIEASQIDTARKRVEDVISEAGEKRREAHRQMERLERRGTLPTLAALKEARQNRDGLWNRVLGAWMEGRVEEHLDDGLPLTEAYPQTVKIADHLADRLRDEAESVSQAEELRSKLRDLDITQAEAEGELKGIEATRADWRTRWKTAWSDCSISPTSPAEMLEWRDQWIEFRSRFESWDTADQELSAIQAEIETAERLLAPLLPKVSDKPLPALRADAIHQLRAADEAHGARVLIQAQQMELENKLKELANRQGSLSQSLERARQTWTTQCGRLGLPIDASTESALVLLQAHRQLITHFDTWNSLRRAIEAKSRSIDDYEAQVQSLANAVGLAGTEVEVRQHALWTTLGQARAQQARQQQAESDLGREAQHNATLRQKLDHAESKVEDALAACALTGEPALKSLLTALKERHALDAQIEGLRKSLHGSARGEPLDTFVERVRAEPGDSLAVERDQLDQTITNLETERDQAVRVLARLEREKSELEQSGAEASESLQAARNTAAAIRHDASRYLRLRLAIHFLNDQIEQFRKQNQAPLLARAGELFKTVTEGSFDSLSAAFGEDDKPMLVGLREGKEVGISGMSDGTRDQLYLALRFAAIERHQAHHEPMPIVLDDLLATFDDRRCRAILPILHDLGTKTQVMLFTHHRHLVELARETLREEDFRVLELDSKRSISDANLGT